MSMRRTLLVSAAAGLVGGAMLPARAGPEDFAAALTVYQAGDPVAAVTRFRELAEGGDVRAQLNLALMLRRGHGRPRNDEAAFYWAWRARLGGHQDAPRLTEVIAADLPAVSVQQVARRLDEDLAALADAGRASAMLDRARVALRLAADPDLEQALAWASVAAALGVPGAAELRDALGRELGGARRVAAQKRAERLFEDWCAAASDRCG
ncbi:SEL1-like repeat protein [Rhodosalinus sediminis]|nr:SEL1-like repeat protein [Rhodosalinus sediminis]